MNRSPGILSPMKTSSEDRSPESPEDEQEETFATRTAREENMSDPKNGSKFVRVLTVMAYVLCVSMAAILLSLYYVLVWDPPKHTSDDVDSPSALRAERQRLEMDYDSFNNPFWIQNYSTDQLNKIMEPTPIPLLQEGIFTTPNTSFNYLESEKMEIEVPEYEDSFTIVNDSFVEKDNAFPSNNFTEDGRDVILKRLKSVYEK